MYRDDEIRTFRRWSKTFLRALQFLEKQCMHLLCSQLLKSLIDLPLESKGRGQDPKSDLGFSEIVKNVNNLHLFLWGISVAMMVCFQLSLFHYIDVLYKIQDSILLFLPTASFYHHIKIIIWKRAFLFIQWETKWTNWICMFIRICKIFTSFSLLQSCFSPFPFLFPSRAAYYSSVQLKKCTTMNTFTLTWIAPILLRTKA